MSTLVRFNVQNVKYATKSGSGWGTPVAYGSAKKMALESEGSSKKIYGDGQVICTLVNDRGKKATLTVNNISDSFEIAAGRKMAVTGGVADVSQQKAVDFAVYFETCGMDDTGKEIVAKTWLFGVKSVARPAESFDQNTDDINESSFDLALEINGVNLKASGGATDYVDSSTGKTVKVWQVTAMPTDTGYSTFENAVPTPTAPAAAAVT